MTFKNVKLLYKLQKAVINFINDYSSIVSEVKRTQNIDS